MSGTQQTPTTDQRQDDTLTEIVSFLQHHFPGAEGLPETAAQKRAKAEAQHPQQHTSAGGVGTPPPHKGA